MGRHLIGRRTGMRSTRVKLASAVAVLGVAATTTAAVAGGGGKTSARLSGFEEVPVVLTTGQGTFTARISRTEDRIDYTLRYADLEGIPVTQAHIHIGQRLANGGVAVWLCGNPSTTPPITPPAGTQRCPVGPDGEVTGTITPPNIVGVPSQGVDPGEFDELVRAMRLGLAYANVHTEKSPGGEIRGQIAGGGDDDSDDDSDSDSDSD
jgi:CHRD domain